VLSTSYLPIAIELAKDAFYVADSPKDRVLSKLTEAKGYNKLRNDPENLLNAYLTAIQEAIAYIPLETMIAEQIIPLESFVLIGKYLVYSGFYLESINILLYASSIYNSAILAYLLGLSYLRLDRFDEAEEVFLEANLLDNRHADVWSYLAIIAIHKGYHRIPEAEQCLYQTLRLGQSDPIILRELATAFMSIDKLQTAEELVRRTIAIEVNNSINSKPSSYTRKLLADILAGQNMAAKAIDEYKQLLMDETIDFPQKLAIAEKCSNLLISLGRDEEVQSLQQIMENMRLDQ
jgi:tetratricopeptide (TPR) repeat protein